jgi:hypothetical protein
VRRSSIMSSCKRSIRSTRSPMSTGPSIRATSASGSTPAMLALGAWSKHPGCSCESRGGPNRRSTEIRSHRRRSHSPGPTSTSALFWLAEPTLRPGRPEPIRPCHDRLGVPLRRGHLGHVRHGRPTTSLSSPIRAPSRTSAPRSGSREVRCGRLGHRSVTARAAVVRRFAATGSRSCAQGEHRPELPFDVSCQALRDGSGPSGSSLGTTSHPSARPR